MSDELTITSMFFELNGTVPTDPKADFKLVGDGIFGGGIELSAPMAGMDLSLSAVCPFSVGKGEEIKIACDIKGQASLVVGPAGMPYVTLLGSVAFQLPCGEGGVFDIKGDPDVSLVDAGLRVEEARGSVTVPCNADAPEWKVPGAVVAKLHIEGTDIYSPLIDILNVEVSAEFYAKQGGGFDLAFNASADKADFDAKGEAVAVGRVTSSCPLSCIILSVWLFSMYDSTG